MRVDDIVLDEDEDDGGGLAADIQAAADRWLVQNYPRLRFSVLTVSSQAGLWQVVIQSPAHTLGATEPATLENALEEALAATFHGETFLVTGAQRANTKRSSLRRNQ